VIDTKFVFPTANYNEILKGKRRSRRSVDGFDGEVHNYTYSKMVLIHALGNTGGSRDHLLTYMRPGQGDNSWRRAAILGMRHFDCKEVVENYPYCGIIIDRGVPSILLVILIHEIISLRTYLNCFFLILYILYRL
jgi:hypothetical protein